MSTILVPYNQAMRLGQGYNTYLQKICIDRAVTFSQEAIQTGAYTPPKLRKKSLESDIVLLKQETTSDDAGTAQTVTYKAAFPDRISDVIEDLNISAAAGIRAGKLSVNGSTAYINESKFKESHINFFVNVKVTNDKLVLNQELVTFNEMKSVIKNSNTFTEHYGDGFISSFISGGELSAIVNIKLIDPSYLLNVKASLQGAIKWALDNKEEPTTYANSISNKIAETNITINWTGGGQAKDPNFEWRIPNLLCTAMEFPGKVAKCPQATWAVITKYQHLRDYVEKVQYPIYMQYELATSYTGTLLENFIEYMVMMKSIPTIMGNLTEYQKADAKDAYDLDAVSLLKASMDVKREMTRIVMRVNELNLDPMKALDLAKDPLPDGVTKVTDPHSYTVRLPVKRTILESRLAKVKLIPPNIQKPTPRSRLDPIIYTTKHSSSPSTTGTFDSIVYKFPSPRTEPPQFATGITCLDINRNGGSGTLHLVGEVTNVTKEYYKVSVNSLIGTGNYSSTITFFEVARTDPDFQQGRIITYMPSLYPNDTDVRDYTRFARTFAEDVEVVVWLTQIDAQCFKAGFLYIDTCLQSVSSEGFELLYKMCGGSQYLGCSWIAYPKSNPGIDSGWIDRLVLGLTGNSSEESNRLHKVTFKKVFKKPPQVWLAWSGVNLILPDNIRLKTHVVQDSITAKGFEFNVRAWGKSVLVTGSLCWLAVEMDK